MLNNKTRKYEFRKKKMNSGKSLKPMIISQIHNPLNSRFVVNQETQFNVKK